MALTITHSTPADGTFSATGATAWNATHSFTVSGTTGELQYNNAGDLAGMSGTSWDDTTRSLTLTGATLTASSPVLNLSQTWNNAAVTFTGLKFNATDTASASGSLLMDLQRGGTSRLNIRKDGAITVTSVEDFNPNVFLNSARNIGIGSYTGGLFTRIGSETPLWLYSSGSDKRVQIGNGYLLGFAPSSGGGTSFPDLILSRRGPANLRLGAADAASPQAQTLSVQSVVAGTSNTAGQPFTITGSQGTGNAAGGEIVFQVASSGSFGTAQNTLSTAMSIVPLSSGTSQVNFGNTGYVQIVGSGININNSRDLSFIGTGAGRIIWASDTILARDAANTLALRNGANAQTQRIYGSFTSASVYKRLALSSTTTVATVAAETDTGDMDLALTPAGAGNVRYGTHSAIGAETVTGYIEIKDAGGTIRKLAVVS